jgi:hypothetical protein
MEAMKGAGRWLFGLFVAGLFGVAILAGVRSVRASSPGGRLRSQDSPCAEVNNPGCPIKTLDPVTLTDQNPKFGNLPLGPARGKAVISPDQAIVIAWNEDARPDAATRQAVLGTADPSDWGIQHPLVYEIVWTNVCVPIFGPRGRNLPACAPGQTWETVIDATTGEFVVSGS